MKYSKDFKIGDIITPINGVKTSGNYQLKKLEKLEVLTNTGSLNLVEIINGVTYDEYLEKYSHKGDNIYVYVYKESFKKINDKVGLYEIF